MADKSDNLDGRDEFDNFELRCKEAFDEFKRMGSIGTKVYVRSEERLIAPEVVPRMIGWMDDNFEVFYKRGDDEDYIIFERRER